MATKKFRCKVCGYIHEGDKAPDVCPVCQAPASEFEEITEPGEGKKKKGVNTNGNSYTLIYMTVIIVIVSLLLSVVSGILKERQNKNVRLDTMKQMCVRRHLAPIYGQRNALAPEKKDYMAMEYVPDIFVTGHVHGVGEEIYNGVRMINASTWQSQTEYQRQHNFNPDPGIMPVVDLGNGQIRMHNFHE